MNQRDTKFSSPLLIMCSKEWGIPSREQIWLLFIITSTRHGDRGADLRSTKMRANRLVIRALFPELSCIPRSPKPAWILIAERFRGPSPPSNRGDIPQLLHQWLAVDHCLLTHVPNAHPSLLWCLFTVLCRKLQSYSEFSSPCSPTALISN